MSLSYNYPPQMAYPSAPPVYRAVPAPPRLHWGWVLVLSVVTLGVFGMVWMVVVGWWIKKATNQAAAFWWSLVYMLVVPLGLVLGVAGAVMTRIAGNTLAVVDFRTISTALIRLASFLLYLVAAFGTKSLLEVPPIDIPLSGVMTFLFAPIYFQYHLHDYSVEGKVAEQLSGFGEPALAGASTMVVEAPEVPPQV